MKNKPKARDCGTEIDWSKKKNSKRSLINLL